MYHLRLLTISHEFSHIIQNVLIWEYIKTHSTEYRAAQKAALRDKKKNDAVVQFYSRIQKEHKAEILQIAKEMNPKRTARSIKAEMSRYGNKRSSDFFAEAFANAECGEPNTIGKAMKVFLERNVTQ